MGGQKPAAWAFRARDKLRMRQHSRCWVGSCHKIVVLAAHVEACRNWRPPGRALRDGCDGILNEDVALHHLPRSRHFTSSDPELAGTSSGRSGSSPLVRLVVGRSMRSTESTHQPTSPEPVCGVLLDVMSVARCATMA